MPKVWTLEQRGISRPGPASLAVEMGEAEQAGARSPSATRNLATERRSRRGRRTETSAAMAAAPRHLSLCSMPAERQSHRLRPAPDARDHDRGADQRGRRRHPPARRRAGRLGGADGGRAGRRARPLRLHRRRDRRPCCGRCWSRWTVELRLVETAEASGAYVHDRRSGEREPIAQSASMPPSRHEIDELFSITVAAALDSDVLALCGPYPGEALPLEIYGNLVADVKANGTPVDRRPLPAAARQRPGGRARPGQDQRLGAGRLHRGPGRHRGADARGGAAAARRRRRRGDHHPRRGAGDGRCAATRPGS